MQMTIVNIGLTTPAGDNVPVLEALNALRLKRVYMITPYPDDINDEEVGFLAHYGVEVAGYDSFRCEVTDLTAAVSSEAVAELALRHRVEIGKCDGVFISCTQLLTMDQIEALESKLGCGIVTSNQATLWAGLNFLGVRAQGVRAGRLFGVSGTEQTTAAVSAAMR